MNSTITEYTPVEYLKIDIASTYGKWEGKDLEKLNFEDRIDWFNARESNGELVGLITTADEPALYFAGLQAYRDCLDGKAIGYPISLDACSSGLQILAVLSNCPKSAKRCGIVPTGKREDAYTSLFENMVEQADFKLSASRADMKQAIMTSLYGSVAEPRELFGRDTPALRLFYRILETEIPGAWSLNLALKNLWRPWALEHEWVLPDGFEVCMAVEDNTIDAVQMFGETIEVFTKQAKGTPSGLSLSPNIVHSVDGMIVREVVRRCYHDARRLKEVEAACNVAMKRRDRRKSTSGHGRKQDKELRMLWERYLASGFLSARVLDLIDEKNVSMISAHAVLEIISTLPVKAFPVLCIHDCFRVHPNYGNDLRRQYNHVMSELAASDVLGDIASQITGRKQKLVKVGDISSEILGADYALS
jgi:hypothetical protein